MLDHWQGITSVAGRRPIGHAVDNRGMDKALMEEDRTTAVGLARYAYEYIEAAMLVEHNDPTPSHISPVPAYFLALHGIELTLKSYLRHKGVTAKELRGQKYGHDLHACHKMLPVRWLPSNRRAFCGSRRSASN
jgi:hypothetical protein